MSIIYTIIAKDNEKILCDYTDYHGTFEQYTQNLIKKTNNNIPKATITFKDFLFHYISNDNLIYMCMAENNYPIDTAFEFLEVIKENFETTFTKIQINQAYAYSFNNEFKHIIQSKMDYYNEHTLTKNENQLNLLKEGLINTKTELLNSQKFLDERNEKMELIVSKAENMKNDSSIYYIESKKVKDKVKNDKILYRILFILVIISVILFIIICFFLFF
jgi:vesicle-associated membrane protein 7